MSICNLCPRACGVDRKVNTAKASIGTDRKVNFAAPVGSDQKVNAAKASIRSDRKVNFAKAPAVGYCGQTEEIRIARAALHFWEEPCISGLNGSGAIFFSGCPLRCAYCQNAAIALGTTGYAISPEKLLEEFFRLKDEGANNINLVTPTHFVPQLVPILEKAKAQGLNLPVLYNTSAYETVETLRMLDGLIDIYLPDYKYASSSLAQKLSHAPDYPSVAALAIDEMLRQVGEPVFEDVKQTARPESVYVEDSDDLEDAANAGTETSIDAGSTDTFSLIRRGVIIRHLVLPGFLSNSKDAVSFLHKRYGDSVYLSIMNQYTPMRKFPSCPSLERRVTEKEYAEVIDYAIDLGVENGFIQEGETALESFIPEFHS